MTAAWPDPALLAAWSLAHFLWQGVLLVAVAAAVRPLLRSATPTARYAAALGLLGVAALLPLATALVAAHAAPVVPGDAPSSRLAEGDRGMAPLALLAVWTLGAAAGLARLAAGRRRLHQVARRGRRDARLARLVRELAPSLGVQRVPRVVVADAAETPYAAGWRRPFLVVPRGLLAALDPAELRALLLHELAHLRRRDYAVNLGQRVLEAVFWMQPAVRVLSHAVRVEREHCCDAEAAAACGAPLVVAQALVRLESLRAAPRLALAGTGAELGGRVRRLMLAPPHRTAMWPAALTAGLAATAVLGTTAALAVRAAAGSELLRRVAPVFTISAYDPAGPFTVELVAGRARAVRLAGEPVPAQRIVQRGKILQILGPSGTPALTLRLRPDGFTWSPRVPRAP